VDEQGVEEKIVQLRSRYQASITRCMADGPDISSTQLRERIQKGLPVQEFLPDAVADYIEKEQLYR